MHKLLLAGMFAIGFSFACGGDSEPFCGDGNVDPGEQCDTDTEFCVDCQVVLPPQTTIEWSFNKNAVPEFNTDGCIDMGVVMVEVSVEGTTTETMAESCSFRQVVFSDLVPGQYVAVVRPLNSDGELVTSAPIQQAFEATAESQLVQVNVPPEAWPGDYTGSYFFELLWNGTDCESASPMVSEQRVSMTQGGNPVTFLDSEGNSLDGPCTGDTQSAVLVPFGYATLSVQGVDGNGDVQYDEQFETFVGAGIANGVYVFDLVTPMMPDAGVPDAGVPDAGVPDAGVPDAGVPDANP